METLARTLLSTTGSGRVFSISPVLFDLHFAQVLERWRAALQQQCSAEQCRFLYNMSGRLYPRAWTQSTKAPCSGLEFADDAGLIATLCASAQMALEMFQTVSSAFGIWFAAVCVLRPKTLTTGQEDAVRRLCYVSPSVWL